MYLLKPSLATLAVALIGVLPLSAQTSATPAAPASSTAAAPRPRRPMGRKSPHETFSFVFGPNRVVIVYGRPYSKDPSTGEIRKIWGGLIGGPANPWGQPWRMGSDEATVLLTTASLKFGDLTIGPGAYSLYMLPQETGASQLIINRKVGQWGIVGERPNGENITYTDAMKATEVGRVDLKKDDLPAQIDQFTMQISKTADGGVLKLMWETTEFSVPFSVVP